MRLNPSSRTRARRSRALVVEDEPLLAEMICDTLRDAGYANVTVTGRTDEVLEILRRGKRLDLVMLDVHLADRDDGWAVAELLQGLPPPRPHIIFSTATPQDIPDPIAALGDVLEKPYTPETLARALPEPRRGAFLARWLQPAASRSRRS
jgi:CheY-like chemotaxis protein